MRLLPLLAVLALTFGCGAVTRMGASMVTHPWRMPIVGGPGVKHEEISIHTDDGLTLDGWLFHPNRPARGLLVLLHGKDANRQHLVGAAGRFVAEGYAVLAYDQRAHGTSEGRLCTYGVREVADLRRALDQVGIQPVYVVGESLGAAVALQAAAEDSRISGVVAAASFAELSTVIEARRPFFMSRELAAAAVAFAEEEAGFKVSAISPARAAESIRVPTLLLHGSDDHFIAPAHARRILERLGGPKRLVWLEGVGHADVLLHRESWDVVDAWLRGVASQPGSSTQQSPLRSPVAALSL